MSERIAIQLQGVGKMYKMFPSRFDNFLDALNLSWMSTRRKNAAREFWALRGVNLEVKAGSRLGIIGRNGAGKSTLLKLITQNKAPTEGTIRINGQVQALLEAGAGFHPEFTGYENIRASLIYQGLEPRNIQKAIEDIEEFTELGQFLSQPFKTYSAGMQARLTFATATTLNPDILIVDEILGAGDAYFAGKSLERMKDLVENSGATVLIVSHSLNDILQYCTDCIWLERGRIVQSGPALEIVKAYEQFIHILDERRLKAKNYKKNTGRDYNADQLENYSDGLLARFYWKGSPNSYCDISAIRVLKDGLVEEEIAVGAAQDSSSEHSAHVLLNGGNWSAPRTAGERSFRRLGFDGLKSVQSSVHGDALFYIHALYAAAYSLVLDYCQQGAGSLLLEMWQNGNLLSTHEIPTSSGWGTAILPLPALTAPKTESPKEGTENLPLSESTVGARVKRRWPGKATVVIERIKLLNLEGLEKTVFEAGSGLVLHAQLRALKPSKTNLVLTAALYRLDGILITKFRSRPVPADMKQDDTRIFELEINPLNLGNHNFVISVALFEDSVSAETRLDLIDRSFEFRVIGNDEYYSQTIINLPNQWELRT